ncbi:hypothetical protein GQR58_027054 [Nymphon striatum]|nr:hypothetical protein GQR58_027054 [Nymphon striatum]
MARSAKSRNTRSTRKPVTIDLEAEAVAEDNNEVSDTNENSSQPDVTETASDEIKVDGVDDTPENVDDMPENNEPKKADVEEGVLPQPVAAPSKAGGITGGVIGGIACAIGRCCKALANVEIAGEKIEALNTKIGNVEKKLASGGGSSNAGLNTLSTRISKLENKMFNSTGTASPELTSTISALEEKLGSVGNEFN